jgi:hypothetical protein
LPMSSEWSLPFRFYNQNFVYISYVSHTLYIPRTSHPPRFDHRNSIEVKCSDYEAPHSAVSSVHYLKICLDSLLTYYHPFIIQGHPIITIGRCVIETVSPNDNNQSNMILV